uniref:Uncharacterized protein n=1 Tax=Avena sativa TaxID=4498 RepID=A0ACD5W0N1_AVESA
MENPLLMRVIDELPLLLDDFDLVQHLLDQVRAQIHSNVISLGEVAGGLEEYQRGLDGLLVATSRPSRDLHTVAVVEDCIQMLQRQRRQLNAALAMLVVARAVAYVRSRSRLVPGVLLATASAAVVPRFRSFFRFSVLTLGFLLISDRPRPRRALRGRLGGGRTGTRVQQLRQVLRRDAGLRLRF